MPWGIFLGNIGYLYVSVWLSMGDVATQKKRGIAICRLSLLDGAIARHGACVILVLERSAVVNVEALPTLEPGRECSSQLHKLDCFPPMPDTA